MTAYKLELTFGTAIYKTLNKRLLIRALTCITIVNLEPRSTGLKRWREIPLLGRFISVIKDQFVTNIKVHNATIECFLVQMTYGILYLWRQMYLINQMAQMWYSTMTWSLSQIFKYKTNVCHVKLRPKC